MHKRYNHTAALREPHEDYFDEDAQCNHVHLVLGSYRDRLDRELYISLATIKDA